MWRYRNKILIQLGFICLFAFNGLCDKSATDEAPIIKTENGPVKGKIEFSRKNRPYYAYKGIPYAFPPVGNLRFKSPSQSPPIWHEPRESEDANICMQRNIYVYQEEIVGSEDCLYLNIYRPKTENNSQFPVMIWFHGGGWIAGGGISDFYGAKFMLDHNVVLITVNYRLGALGFLSTEDEVCPGNLGLKDQTRAMQWIKNNVGSFGGDSDKITIFGESAGGASVHYHMISGYVGDYFHRAISQSGNFYNPWTLARKGSARENAKKLGAHLNCFGNSQELIKCLREKDAKDIIGADRIFQKFGYCPMIPFKPVIEQRGQMDITIKEDPISLGKMGAVADIPWMTGITSGEGALKVAGLYGRQKHLLKELNDNFTTIAPMSLFYKDFYKIDKPHMLNEISNSIREFYFGANDIDESEEVRYSVIDMYSDAWFNHGTHEAVRDFIKSDSPQKSSVYYYYFTYKGSVSFSSIFGDRQKDYGVSHADELQYLFPVGEKLFNDTELSSEDNRMIDIMTRLWYNFANSGNPSDTNVKWEPAKTAHSPEYLHIESPQKISMKNNLLWQRMTFWDALVERMNTFGTDSLRDEF